MAKHRVSLIFGSLLLALLIGWVGCERPSPTSGRWFYGEALAINLLELIETDAIYYNDLGEDFVIRPQNPNNNLVAAHLEVRNRLANTIFLRIDEQGTRITDGAYTDYPALNPLESRLPAESSQSSTSQFTPFIWGPVELPQNCIAVGGQVHPCKLQGWVLFEVPKGQELVRLVWDTVDSIFIYFEERH